MYETMKAGIEKMNEMFGTNATIICNIDYTTDERSEENESN